MPVRKVKNGWQWGRRGKVYREKWKAARQGRAAYAHGYRGESKIRRLVQELAEALTTL